MNVLSDFSETALIEAIEGNLFEMLPVLCGCLPNAAYEGKPDVAWFMTGIPFALFNGVIHARLAPDDLDARIREVVAPFESGKKPMVWWTGPSTQPDDLGDHLQACSLLYMDDSPGMAVDLDALQDLPSNPAVTVRRAASLQNLVQWGGPFAANFEVPKKFIPQLCESVATLGFDEDRAMHNYLGMLDGNVVGTCTLFLGAGVAGIYNVSTLPKARQQGVATALTLTALRAARDRGYRIGILHASEMGYGVYRRIGFRDYCTISHYLYLPSRAQRAFLKFYLWAERLIKNVRQGRKITATRANPRS
ncbi:MAG: GNAT family N-acetyltransferase [Anaerolineae bacterium]